MKRIGYFTQLGAALLLCSAALYLLHFAIFDDKHHIFIFLVADIAFLPIEVLIVSLVIHRLLSEREKRSLLEKLNMVIGAFFSEVGTYLIEEIVKFDSGGGKGLEYLAGVGDWRKKDFAAERIRLAEYGGSIDAGLGDLPALRSMLTERRGFMLRLLENPNLLEHESFTDLLWAVFHLTEEALARSDLAGLPESDLKHLSGDIGRVYGLLLVEWLLYMEHLKDAYPYLFSLALRTNPFDPKAKAEVA